jgi:hypothetical protein
MGEGRKQKDKQKGNALSSDCCGKSMQMTSQLHGLVLSKLS